MFLFFYDFYGFLPEIFFFFSILILLVLGSFFEKHYLNKINNIFYFLCSNSFLILIFYLLLLINQQLVNNFYFYDSMLLDNLSLFLKSLIILVFIFFLFMIQNNAIKDNFYSFEFLILLFFTILGYLFLISCYNFLNLYLALELSSFCLYLLASFKKYNLLSTESGLKYFILGAFSSGILLFGISIIYVCSGSINFYDLSLMYEINLINSLYYSSFFGIFLILCGIFFKLAVVPFHL
jgi:NADH-quinone oxidoreductase subunit N